MIVLRREKKIINFIGIILCKYTDKIPIIITKQNVLYNNNSQDKQQRRG